MGSKLKDIDSAIQDDMWIAALCKQYGYALATADKAFGAITGLELISF